MKLKVFLLITLIAVLTEAKVNDVVLLKGRIHSFDSKQVLIELATHSNAVVPREAIPADFKLSAISDRQTIPVYTKSVPRVRLQKMNLLDTKDLRSKLSAKSTLESVQAQQNRSQIRK